MFVAGDDALLPNCILDYINFSSQHPQMKICQSIGRMYKTNLLESSYIGNYIHPKHNLFYQHPNNTNWQYKVLLHWNPVAAPSVIINANIFKEIGMFNPDLPLRIGLFGCKQLRLILIFFSCLQKPLNTGYNQNL